MNYLRANIFWKNLMKNAIPGVSGVRREKEKKDNGPKKAEKSLFLRLLVVLAAIVAAALLYSLIAAWR